MYNLGLSAGDMQAYTSTLATSHTIRIRVYSMDLSHNNRVELQKKLLDGQVSVNANAIETTRVLTAYFLDPTYTLGWDSTNPTTGAPFMDNMVQVFYGVYVPNLSRSNKWVDVPIFTGPIVKVERSGAVVSIEAHGKEILAGEVWGTFKIPNNTNKTVAIRSIMERAGEHKNYMSLKSTTGKMTETSIGYDKTYWSVTRSIANSINQHVHYNGAGCLVTRSYPPTTAISFVFNDGTKTTARQKAVVMDDPDVTYESENVKNAVRVIGKKKGNKAPPFYTAYPSINSGLHPSRVGRNGKSRFLVEVIQDDRCTSTASCKSRAQTVLASRMQMAVAVKFDSLPVPHLEPYDWVLINTSRMSHIFRMDEFTIPLSASGTMSIGYVKKVTVNTAKPKKRSSTKKK